MSFTLSSKAELATSLGRVTASELDELMHSEASKRRTLDERVHEARKSLKRLRSLFRLYRGGLRHATFEREDASLRALGHALAAFRDEATLVESLQALIGSAAPSERGALGDHVTTLRKALQSSEPRNPSGAEAALHAVEDRLGALRLRAPSLTVDRQGWTVIAPGLRRTYASGRRAFTRTLDQPSEGRLHRLRTNVKRHQYQLELLEPIWPGPVKACRQEAKRLGELLGEEHDLSLLERRFETLGNAPGVGPLVPALKHAADARHAELRRQAFELGARVYAEPPGRFAARFREYFDAWP